MKDHLSFNFNLNKKAYHLDLQTLRMCYSDQQEENSIIRINKFLNYQIEKIYI